MVSRGFRQPDFFLLTCRLYEKRTIFVSLYWNHGVGRLVWRPSYLVAVGAPPTEIIGKQDESSVRSRPWGTLVAFWDIGNQTDRSCAGSAHSGRVWSAAWTLCLAARHAFAPLMCILARQYGGRPPRRRRTTAVLPPPKHELLPWGGSWAMCLLSKRWPLALVYACASHSAISRQTHTCFAHATLRQYMPHCAHSGT